MGKYKAYIFDLDGTLFDSMDVWDKVDRDFFAKRGLEMPPDYKSMIIPMNLQEAAVYTIGRFGLREDPGDIVREWTSTAAAAYESAVRMKPHALEYLEALAGRGVKLAVATSLPAELYAPALRGNGVGHFFDAVASTTETGRGKSYPDVYLLAARKLGAEPGECVLFEDILKGVISAKSIGMAVYGVYDKSSDGDWEKIKEIADGALADFRGAYDI